uniref:Uncharacterized protein n=1 Tax=Mycena chlorophos TaxID=658473 RepID=A0ABQ0LS84_MYCCL|nr:predicted protein [Mycena chlorophos]
MASLLRSSCISRRVLSSLSHSVDAAGIPSRPTWSVNELLASYPRPTLPPSALKRLHDLSALVPPEENSPEYIKLKTELEELIRLVEAVKLVDTTGVRPYRPANVISTSSGTSNAPTGFTSSMQTELNEFVMLFCASRS